MHLDCVVVVIEPDILNLEQVFHRYHLVGKVYSQAWMCSLHMGLVTQRRLLSYRQARRTHMKVYSRSFLLHVQVIFYTNLACILNFISIYSATCVVFNRDLSGLEFYRWLSKFDVRYLAFTNTIRCCLELSIFAFFVSSISLTYWSKVH